MTVRYDHSAVVVGETLGAIALALANRPLAEGLMIAACRMMLLLAAPCQISSSRSHAC
ncbi:hypothetical protein [Actinomadura violacea]|uniref:Uncharacterized protein n=1 Tax=Actinomadura violacea TaxID=2819934 RepID=A0ABS3RN27_9ACTN|nr:hypothetical protein [Actinomadura violacea]MBO2458127.1 hypothetical protein [Actinomadura violacea]